MAATAAACQIRAESGCVGSTNRSTSADRSVLDTRAQEPAGQGRPHAPATHPARRRHPEERAAHRGTHGQHRQAPGKERRMSNAISRCPVGATENSPAFQRWVNVFENKLSPVGTAEVLDMAGTMAPDFFRPYGTRFPCPRYPPLKRWAIVGRPPGQKSCGHAHGARVGAEHHPQQVQRPGRIGYIRARCTWRNCCGWSVGHSRAPFAQGGPRMSKSWPTVRLGEVLRRSEETIELQPDVEYRQITVKLWGKGVMLRGVLTGAGIAASRQMGGPARSVHPVAN